MNADLKRALAIRGTDVDGALERCCGDEALYTTCLKLFLDDPTMGELDAAIGAQRWDDAFTAAHALKGLAGNMGFVPLMHATGRMVVLIRGGRIKELRESFSQITSCYRDVTDAILEYATQKDLEGKANEG